MLQELLRLGLYQIFWLDRIPSHAAVDETVEMAKQHGFGAQAGFVNALLRGYVRELEATKAPAGGAEDHPAPRSAIPTPNGWRPAGSSAGDPSARRH